MFRGKTTYGASGIVVHSLRKGYHMLRLAVLFLVIALVAGLLGFGGIESVSWDGARILFFVFLVLAVLSLLGGGWRRRARV